MNPTISNFFEIRGNLSKKTETIIEISGLIFLLLIWWSVVNFGLVRASILPSPVKVLTSMSELVASDNLIDNVNYSIKLNLFGYLESILIAIPIGFVIGLFPFFRSMFSRIIGALRYLPLTAMIGLFILWCGIGANMKVQFLTLGILVYLLPVVVQRIDEVLQVYIDTVKTLGATKWQIIKSVFIPDVISRLFDDIRVLVAISWTYIIITEVINMQDGGVGALIYQASRQSRTDKVFAILIIILLIGFLQDKLFQKLDKVLFPHKYA